MPCSTQTEVRVSAYSQFLNWHVVAAILSGVCSVISMYPYVRNILWGKTRPSMVTFFLWTVLEAIAFAAQVKAGASWSLLLMGCVIVNTSIITVLAAIGYGYRSYTRFDVACALFCILAAALWQATGDPVVAIIFAIIADLCAALPTIKKAHLDPDSENVAGWFWITLACLFGVLSSEIHDMANLAFPMYLVLVSGLICSLVYVGRRRRTLL